MTILLRQKPLPQVVRQIVQRDNGAWFDPEDMSTMFQDAAGTIPVTALEQPVGLWLDKSGNGNHTTQPITASRPTLSARYNLLTKTENFADGAWIKSNISILQTMESTPIGVRNVTKITDTTTLGYHIVSQLPLGGASNRNFSFMVKSVDCPNVTMSFRNNGDVRYDRITVSLTTGTVIPAGANFSSGEIYYNIKSLGDGWFYISGYVAYATTRVSIGLSDTNAADQSREGNLYTGAGKSILVICPCLSGAATPLPYQRVNTATDYDSVGWPRYLRGDGIDDFYNLPFMNLYGNGSCSIVAARDAISQATDTYIISERSTTDVDPKYFPSRQLASGGNMDSYIVSDEGTVRLDTTGSAFSGVKLAAIRSVVDSGNNIKLFKDGAVVADDNYTRAGTLTLNNTTIGASVSTTTGNYANMRLYGIIITKSALSDTDRRRCEQFLASRLSTLGVTLS